MSNFCAFIISTMSVVLLCLTSALEGQSDQRHWQDSRSQTDSTILSAFSEEELDNTQIGITIVFKPETPIPLDAVLNSFLPLEGHRGPFGRRFVASARRIRDALHLDGFHHRITSDGFKFHVPVGKSSLPKAWSENVRVILGLDNCPIAKPHYRMNLNCADSVMHATSPQEQDIPSGWPPFGFFPQQLAQIYEFPKGGLGEGQTIGIVEFTLDEPGRTAGFFPEDVLSYFEMIGISPPPQIEVVSVDGAQNTPTLEITSGDIETCLDIELAGAIAPRAKIIVFFAPNTSAGFYDGFATMLSPPYNVTVASASYGTAEIQLSHENENSYALAFEELFASVASQKTMCVSTGDSGSALSTNLNIMTPGTAQANFPASCPHALACGGTTLLPNGDHTKRFKEVVWNWGGGEVAGSGGISTIFEVPDYQSEHGIYLRSINNKRPGRAIPDVALHADPERGYNIRVSFVNLVIGGTSGSTPMWAALIARLNYLNGGKPLGFINPLLYSSPDVLRKIKQGSNGQYFANGKYDACTGLGVPSRRIRELIHPCCSKGELEPYDCDMPEHLKVMQSNDKSQQYALLDQHYQAPQEAFLLGSFSEKELVQETVGMTVIFKEKVQADIEMSLNKWAQAQGLTFEGSRGPFACRLSGSAKRICEALNLSGFNHWQVGDVKYRVPSSDIKLPAQQPWVSKLSYIAGLDTQPLHYCSGIPTHEKETLERKVKQILAVGRAKILSHDPPFPFPGVPSGAWNLGFFPFELARIYDYSKKGFGEGQSVAVIELAAGYSDVDLANYWAYMGIGNPPTVSWIGVDGATNDYSGNPSSNDWIPTSDIEIIGTIAPDCSIQVIFAPNTVDGFYDAIAAALFDNANTIVSTVWGRPEVQWPFPLMLAIDQMIAEATKSGITVIASTGSQGSSDGISDGLAHVDFPASSPHVLAVGSTTLLADSYHKKRVIETAWNSGYGLEATGGGVSEVFGIPKYQKKYGIKPTSVNPCHRKGRGVPDVSSVGDPTIYPIPIFVDMSASYTRFNSLGGTVATPTWAGLVARLKSISKKPLGLLQPRLYKHRKEWFTDITKGNNGAYRAKKGYDLTTGLGVPNGRIVEIAENER